MFLISYPNDWRKLRYLINEILKSWSANEVKRINYSKSYKLNEWKISKQDEKILLISFQENQKAKLESLLKKHNLDYISIS